MNRFKTRAVLKTDTHNIIVTPYAVYKNGYYISLFDIKHVFEQKYPEDSVWDFLDIIEKQPHIQEISEDGEIVIVKDFTGLMSCIGLEDKKGKLIYENDIVLYKGDIRIVMWDKVNLCHSLVYIRHYSPQWKSSTSGGKYNKVTSTKKLEVIGNVYESPELLKGLEECLEL